MILQAGATWTAPILAFSVSTLLAEKIASNFTNDNRKIDMSVVRDRKRKMVDGLIAMHLDNFKASGAELLWAPDSSSDQKPSRSHSLMVLASAELPSPRCSAFWQPGMVWAIAKCPNRLRAP